jgi:hypothetical protein
MLIAGLSDEEVEAAATLGGGSWSIRDLIGHLASWEERALPWLGSADAFDSRSFPSTDEFNEAEVARKASWSLAALREEARQVHRRVLDSIEGLDEEAWLADAPVPGRDPHPRGFVVGKILGGDEHGLFAHDLAHLNDVEVYVRALSSGSPTHD